MTHLGSYCVSVAACCALLLVICGQAAAFDPKPDPLNAGWRVEGFADLLATSMDPTDTKLPFGLDPAIVDDDVVDFVAGIIATFHAPDNDGDTLPDDGLYASDLKYFRLRIGDTMWDETMPGSGLALQVEGGVVIGIDMTLTVTMPGHPDLTFMPPASPGMWEALDERDGVDLGTVSGSYSLRDGTVPEPSSLLLLGLGGLGLLRRRFRAARP